MNKVLVPILFVIATLNPSFSCFADSDFDQSGVLLKLEEVIKSSLRDNFSVKRAEARLKKEEELYLALKRSIFPKLTTDLYTAAVTEANKGVIFSTTEIRLPIFEGGRRLLKKERSPLKFQLKN